MFLPEERQRIDEAIRRAETKTRFEFSVYVGLGEGDPRDFAESLHAQMAAPDRSVLVMISLEGRVVEIVTGCGVRRVISDLGARDAASEIASLTASGDVVLAVVSGLDFLAAASSQPDAIRPTSVTADQISAARSDLPTRSSRGT